VLVAIGRVPNGKNLDAGKAGVEVDDRGFIRVDKQLRTNVPHILLSAISSVSQCWRTKVFTKVTLPLKLSPA
jgi:alkyl hydroperoxide reductase subunit AhpF